MAKLPDGYVFDRVDYVVQKGDMVVWPKPKQLEQGTWTKKQAEKAALRLGGFVVPCQVLKMPKNETLA